MYLNLIQRDWPVKVWNFEAHGTLKNVPPIIAHNNNSVMIGAASSLTTPFTYMAPGDEQKAFSIELWFAPLSDLNVPLFSHSNVNLVWNAGLQFTAKVNGIVQTVSYTPTIKRAFHVVATYTRSGLALYVDGVLVDHLEWEDEVTPSWTAVTNVIFGGGTGRSVLDGVAFYTKTLSEKVIKEHFELGIDIPAITTNLSDLGGALYHFENQDKFLINRKVWPDWTPGSGIGVEVSENVLVGEAGGSWQTFVSVPDYEVIQKAKVRWVSDAPVTVQVSKDNGATWTSVQNGGHVPGLTGSAPLTLVVMVSFTTAAEVSSLVLETYNSLVYEGTTSNRQITYSSGQVSNADTTYDQLRYRADRGVLLNGSTIVFEADTSEDAEPVYAVDMWVNVQAAGDLIRFNSGEFVSATASGGGTVLYQGKPSYTRENGEWVHITFTLTTPSVSRIVIGGAGFVGQIGSVHLYQKSIAGQEDRIYRSYFGGRELVVTEPNNLEVVEGTIDMYSYDWTTT